MGGSSSTSVSKPPPSLAEILFDKEPKDQPSDNIETGKKVQDERGKQVKKLYSFGSPQYKTEN